MLVDVNFDNMLTIKLVHENMLEGGGGGFPQNQWHNSMHIITWFTVP